MADLSGYVNPRSLGNYEPNQALGMDLFFEQALWDKYIANKNTRRRDLYTWDAMAPFCMRATMGRIVDHEPMPDLTITSYQVKIGHHKPCTVRVYMHRRIMALCVGLGQA